MDAHTVTLDRDENNIMDYGWMHGWMHDGSIDLVT